MERVGHGIRLSNMSVLVRETAVVVRPQNDRIQVEVGEIPFGLELVALPILFGCARSR